MFEAEIGWATTIKMTYRRLLLKLEKTFDQLKIGRANPLFWVTYKEMNEVVFFCRRTNAHTLDSTYSKKAAFLGKDSKGDSFEVARKRKEGGEMRSV